MKNQLFSFLTIECFYKWVFLLSLKEKLCNVNIQEPNPGSCWWELMSCPLVASSRFLQGQCRWTDSVRLLKLFLCNLQRTDRERSLKVF